MALTLLMGCVVYFNDRRQFSREISAQDFGAEWPWPAASKGMLQCHVVRDRMGNELPSLQIVLNGSVYALNSPAIGASGWPDSKQMMIGGEGRVATQGRDEIIRRGRAICGLPRLV